MTAAVTLTLPIPSCLAGVASSSSLQDQVTCDVCMSENSRKECSSNGCGHIFCNTCWRGHLAVQIQDGQARHISCMAYKCGVVCDEELVAQVMKVRSGLQGRYAQQEHQDGRPCWCH